VNRTNRTDGAAPRLRPPRALQPERLARPSHAALVWGSVLLAWLVSLLPWRLWPQAPDVLLLVIVFWCVHEPRRVGLVTAFVFGLLMDVHDAAVLGQTALTYVLLAYGALVLQRRLQRFDPWSQALHMLPLFLGAGMLATMIQAWLAGRWPGWAWAVGAVLTAALWPIAAGVLLWPQRGADDAESASV